MPVVLTRDLPDADATRHLGRVLGQHAQPGDTVLLTGDLGAGKTTLTQGLAEGLGVRDRVTSPTFTLMNEYEGRVPLYHFDLYRIGPEDVVAMGFPDIWESARGVAVLEWADRLGDLGPDSYVRIDLEHAGESRHARLSARGAGVRLLQEVERA